MFFIKIMHIYFINWSIEKRPKNTVSVVLIVTLDTNVPP